MKRFDGTSNLVSFMIRGTIASFPRCLQNKALAAYFVLCRMAVSRAKGLSSTVHAHMGL